MADKTIVIDGYIGPFAYSKQFVRTMLEDTKGKSVLVKISSLGGDLNHAIDIQNQFREHGNITAELSGFVASSATVIALGAKDVRIADNSYYLIHKVMGWVDVFGYFNEDDLQQLIDQLTKDKNESAKMTLNLASMYAKKTGKSTKELLDLMKKETWLDATEAKDWGFVDKVYDPGAQKVNYLDDYKMVAMIEGSGMPKPTRNTHLNKIEMAEETLFKDEISFLAKMKEFFGLTPKEKDSDPDPKESKEVTDLKNEIAGLKTQIQNLSKKEEPKKEEPKKEDSSELTALKNEVEGLKTQIANLGGAPAKDTDPAKDDDTTKKPESNEFMNKVAAARKLYAQIKELN